MNQGKIRLTVIIAMTAVLTVLGLGSPAHAASASNGVPKTSAVVRPMNVDVSIGEQVSVRDCWHPTHPSQPGYDFCTNIIHTLYPGDAVRLNCQRYGQAVGSDHEWDYVLYSGGEGYVTDEYVNDSSESSSFIDSRVGTCSW